MRRRNEMGTSCRLQSGLVAVLFVLLCVVITQGQGNAVDLDRCPSANMLPYTTKMVARPYNKKCYQFVHIERYWTQARDYCRRYGGRLLTLPDAATNSFVLRVLNTLHWKNRGVWIGLHDRADEMVWEWSTNIDGFGEKVTWTNWGRGHPRASFHHFRDCVRMVRGSGTWRWHETPCATFNWKYRSICEYNMRPPMAGHVGTAPTTTKNAPTTRRSTTQHTTTRLSTISSPQRSTTTFRYGVGGDGGVNLLNREALKEVRSSLTPSEATTEEQVDVVIPLSLQQNNNDGHTNMLGGVVVACLIMVLLSLLVIIVVYFRRRRQKKALTSSLSLNVTNPSYCSATCGSIVAANGQTTLLKLKLTNDNEYTDEPLRGRGFVPPYKDDVVVGEDDDGSEQEEEDEYQEVKVVDKQNITTGGGEVNNCTASSAADQNRDNYATEKTMTNTDLKHVYSEPYDVPKKNHYDVPRKVAGARLRPKMPTPRPGHYLAMDGGDGIGGVTSTPRVVSDAYLAPVSLDSSYLTPVSSCRDSNIYAEIPGEDEYGDDDLSLRHNVYETLDDLDKSIRQNNGTTKPSL